jgi:hypothetical protein
MQLVQHESFIRERAYAIWEQEGRPDGREWDHWVRASREIADTPSAKAAPTVAEAPRKKGFKGGGRRAA